MMRYTAMIALFSFVVANSLTTIEMPQRRLCDAEQREGDTRPKPNLTPAPHDPSPNLSPLRREAQKSPGWQPNGIAVCDTAAAALPRIVSDGNHGAIICWTESYRGWPHDTVNTVHNIYAQRVDSVGNFIWQRQGVPVCSLSNSNASYPEMTSDGKGGAIIAWEDDRGGLGYTRVFAQRLDSLGNRLWVENGALVCNQMSGYVDICSDGHGGAIIVYEDGRNEAVTSDDIYAQKIDSAGNPAWPIDGVPVCTADSIQFYPWICYNNQGGAIITWQDDYRNNGTTGEDVYAQMLDSLGTINWTLNGEPLCIKPGMQKSINPITNNKGGGIINWIAFSDTNLAYAQSLDSIGNKLWGDSGVALHLRGMLCNDNRGGGITFNGLTNRVDSLGNICWGSGVSAHDTMSLSGGGDASEDQLGGVVTIWAHSTHLYAQRVDSSGNVIWNTTGVPVCTSMNTEDYQKVVGDMAGGAICAWYGDRLMIGFNNVYAQRVNGMGVPGGVNTAERPAAVNPGRFVKIYPNPFDRQATIAYALSKPSRVEISIYNILGQQVALVFRGRQEAGRHAVSLKTDRVLSAGMYFCMVSINGEKTVRKIQRIK